MSSNSSSVDRITIDKKYTFTFDHDNPVLTCQRYGEPVREIWDKAVLNLFFHARKLEDEVAEMKATMYRSDDLPDLVGSNDISLEDTDIV